jgi:hypothetical protein
MEMAEKVIEFQATGIHGGKKIYIYRRKKQSGLLMQGLLRYNHEGCQQMLRYTWSCKLLKFFYRK